MARLQRPYQCAGTPESSICSGFRRSCTWRATHIAVPSKVEAPVDADVKTADSATMTPTCEPLQMIEGICRRFLDVVKMEWDCQVFAGTRDVRATVLHNIGENEATVGEMSSAGHYQGSTVYYNLNNLVVAGRTL